MFFTRHGLLYAYYQIVSEEDAVLLSDGDCAIKVNFYRNGDTLPAIESADSHHEMIYTAAASTQQYIMHVVGYVHTQEDFSAVCKSINTIRVDASKISDSMLNHTTSTEGYGIIDMSYSATVKADELNVRSTSETGEIVTTLSKGDVVTVTGSVTKNGTEVGWARIKTADGTEGYVSTQFLSIGGAPQAEETSSSSNEEVVDEETSSSSNEEVADENGNTYSTNAYPTGYSVTISTEQGATYGSVIYEYSDGTWRDGAGGLFQRYNAGEWELVSGGTTDTHYYVVDPDYYNDYESDVWYVISLPGGAPIVVYQSGVDRFIDDDGITYYQIGDGVWEDCYGNILYRGYDGSGNYPSEEDDGVRTAYVGVTNEYGDSYCISAGDSTQGIWFDYDTGKVFYPYDAYGTWSDEYGIVYTMVE